MKAQSYDVDLAYGCVVEVVELKDVLLLIDGAESKLSEVKKSEAVVDSTYGKETYE